MTIPAFTFDGCTDGQISYELEGALGNSHSKLDLSESFDGSLKVCPKEPNLLKLYRFWITITYI